MTTISTIGTGGGRDYATITAWEAATDVSLGEKKIGEVYHDGTAGDATYTINASTDRFLMQGATGTSSTRYRQLRAATGQQYDPVLGTGVFIHRTPGASTNLRTCFELDENRFRLSRMAVIDTPLFGSTSGEARHVYSNDRFGVQVNRCYLELSSGFSDGTNGTASGACVRIINNSSASGVQHAKIQSNIIVGGGRRGNRGTSYGIRVDIGGPVDVVGNTVIDVVGHNESSPALTSRGISFTPSGGGGVLIGNLVTKDPSLLTGTNKFDILESGSSLTKINATQDTTGPAFDAFGTAGDSLSGQMLKGSFVSAENQDLRILSTSPCASNEVAAFEFAGVNAQLTFDYFGNTRGTSYAEIGAVQGSLTTTEAPPTVVVSTIGSGGDYSTLAAWETATRGNLVEANEVRIGEVLGEVSGVVEITGSQTDAQRYRMLRSAASAPYKFEDDSGAHLTSTSGRDVVLVQSERHFKIQGPMKISSTTTSNSSDGEHGLVTVREDADFTTVSGLFVTMLSSAAALSFAPAGILVRLAQRGTVIKNCIVTGSNGADNKGVMSGIRVRDLCDGKIFNCTVWGTKLLATIGTQKGISTENNSTFEVRNCIAIDNFNSSNTGSADYALGTASTSSNNLAGDTSGDIDSKTAAETFFSHLSNNYYLRAGTSPAIDAGTSLLSEGVREDFAGNGRNVPFDLGALDGTKPYPPFPAHRFRRRVAHCFEIERRDGVRLQFTDNPTPITFRGATWSPASFGASARRRELGNKPMSLEISGGISSDKITISDLRQGKYQGARLTEYIIDWRYPHLEPMQITRYTIEATTFDGEQFSADVQGLPFVLKTKIGNYYGRTCRHVLANSECRATITTETNIPIASVIQPRVSFYVASLGQTAENYYRFGKLVWNNNGTVNDVFSNKLVTVNQLSNPNVLTPGGVWTATELTVASVSDGFDTGVPSWRLTASANNTTHKLDQLLSTAWTSLAPAKTKVCFSAYFKRESSGSPADHVELRLVNQGSPHNLFRAGFQHNGTAWVSSYNDAGTTVKVAQVGSSSWYRLSVGLTHDGQQPNNIGIGIRVGNNDDESNGERVQVARAQLEVEVLEPTGYTEAQMQKIVLAVKSDFDFAAATRFSLDPGCDKLRSTCKTKFNNIKNFGGFPFIPGQDKQFDTPTQ